VILAARHALRMTLSEFAERIGAANKAGAPCALVNERLHSFPGAWHRVRDTDSILLRMSR